MTFKDFLISKPAADTPSGDFISDVIRDRDFPENEQTYERLTQYFDYQSRMHNNPDVLRIFKRYWKAYTKSLV